MQGNAKIAGMAQDAHLDGLKYNAVSSWQMLGPRLPLRLFLTDSCRVLRMSFIHPISASVLGPTALRFLTRWQRFLRKSAVTGYTSNLVDQECAKKRRSETRSTLPVE